MNVEVDGYECYDWLSIWYRMVLIDYLIWILMLRMDTNVVMDYEFDIGWNVEKDGYKCYDGLSIWYRLGFIVYLICILMLMMDTKLWRIINLIYRLGLIVYLIRKLMLRMDTNVMMHYEFHIGRNIEKDGYKCHDGFLIS